MTDLTMPCGYLDDDRLWDEPENMDQIRAIEDQADSLLADCLTFECAEKVFMSYDLAETDLPANLLMLIANWSGRSADSDSVMKRLHNLLANEMHSVAVAIEKGIY
jgi:hypothetical protein